MSSKTRLIMAFAGMVLSAGVLSTALLGSEDGPATLHDGLSAALDDIGLSSLFGAGSDDDGSEADPAVTPDGLVSPSGSGSGGEGHGVAPPGDPTDGLPASRDDAPADPPDGDDGGLPLARALTRSASAGPDWALLFEKLLERERTAELGLPTELDGAGGGGSVGTGWDAEPSPGAIQDKEPPTPMVDPRQALRERSLQGILSRGELGLVLLDGHLLRVRDTLPGTDWTITAILRDRIQVALPAEDDAPEDESSSAELLLAPLHSAPAPAPARPATGTPPTANTGAAPAHG